MDRRKTSTELNPSNRASGLLLGAGHHTLVDLGTLFFGALIVYALTALIPPFNVPLLGDAVDYFETAFEHWQTGRQVGPNYWPPGVPLFLHSVFAGLGRADQSLAQGATMVCTALTGCFIYLSTLELLRNRRVARWTAICFFLYPTTILMAKQTETHVFCALYISMGSYFMIRFFKSGQIRNSFLVAVAMGLLLLTRPGSAALLLLCAGSPIVARWPAFRNPALQPCKANAFWHAVIVVSGSIAIVTPFLLWNYNHGGGLTISTNNERNFFLGNNKYTHPYKTGHLAWRDPATLPEPTRQYLNEINASAEPRQTMMKEGMVYIRDNPGKFSIRTFNRLKNFWTFDYEIGRRIQRQWATLGKISMAPMLAQAICSTLLIGTFFGSLTVLFRTEHRIPAVMMLAACALYQLPHLLAFSSPVYRTGLTPLIFIISVMGLSALYRRVQTAGISKAHTSGQKPGWAAWAAIAAVLIYINAEAAYYLLQLT